MLNGMIRAMTLSSLLFASTAAAMPPCCGGAERAQAGAMTRLVRKTLCPLRPKLRALKRATDAGGKSVLLFRVFCGQFSAAAGMVAADFLGDLVIDAALDRLDRFCAAEKNGSAPR